MSQKLTDITKRTEEMLEATYLEGLHMMAPLCETYLTWSADTINQLISKVIKLRRVNKELRRLLKEERRKKLLCD